MHVANIKIRAATAANHTLMSLYDILRASDVIRIADEADSEHERILNITDMQVATSACNRLTKLLGSSDRSDPAPTEVASQDAALVIVHLCMALMAAGTPASDVAFAVRKKIREMGDSFDERGQQ